MCGTIHLGTNKLEIDCELADPFWWRHPDPVIDLTRLVLDNPEAGPRPEPWKVELTQIGQILATVGHFRNADLADRLGHVVAEAGNDIAEQAKVDIRFEWTPHATA
ncbi:hypothetical protein OG555_19215 [Kribbella sp. NBC_01484]|uniref:hypothetical protein n=1 Tax=Kribbella sp. NBC_01484 TaxID=2903579 RepID=UPI002E382324|nr:hypothetical protein [Kribbella sp. NBC_01484]